MWGNRLGWMISGAITAGVVVLVVLVDGSAARTATTAFSSDGRNFQQLLPPGPPPALMPPTQPCDGGPLVRQAIAMYLQNRPLYDDFAAIGKLGSPKVDQLAAVDKLVEASGCGRMTLFADRPESIVNFQHTRSDLDALSQLGTVMIDRLALLNARAARPAAAGRYAMAGLTLGLHLCRERLTYDELALGLELIGKSTPVLARLADEAGEADRAAAWRAYGAQKVAFFNEQIDPVARFARSIDPRIVGLRTGDVFELAKRSKERMWRVEAILSLGRVRYFAGESGTAANQRAALALAKNVAQNDPDPVVRAAAKAARDLTIEEYRVQ
jgi:hypothetical protein